MPIDSPQFIQTLLLGTTGIFKIAFILFAIVYFIFSLVVVRQVNLMTETVITEGTPILRFIAFLHAGLALGVIILFIGFL